MILILHFTCCRISKMLIWWEREHEEVDEVVINHQPTLQALRACGLYKFWAISGMRAQVDLLTWLVSKWDVQDQCFVIGGHRLEIELEDIYFFTGLSRRGEPLSMLVPYEFFDKKTGGEIVCWAFKECISPENTSSLKASSCPLPLINFHCCF